MFATSTQVLLCEVGNTSQNLGQFTTRPCSVTSQDFTIQTTLLLKQPSRTGFAVHSPTSLWPRVQQTTLRYRGEPIALVVTNHLFVPGLD